WVHRADARTDQVEPVIGADAANHLSHLGDFAPGDVDPGRDGAGIQSLCQLTQESWVGLLDGDIVNHRNGSGPDADDIVGVHCHTVDADRVVFSKLLSDEDLRSYAVGGYCQSEGGR